MPASKVLLSYNLDKHSLRRLDKLAASLSIRLKPVLSSQYGLPRGVLGGISGIPIQKKPVQAEILTEPMLVFSGLDADTLDLFLEQYQKAALPPVARKAILTPDNVFWDSCALYEELSKEHRAMNL